MALTRRERLREFVAEILSESDRADDVVLDDATSLIGSGLLDSLAILSLAGWIDDEIGAGSLDLESVDFESEWNSIDAVLHFIAAQ